ncbi:hypothetical protein CONPUDRAFT_67100 [Coniophora puteana RWD-64-598 SS2]|uniref:Uncharacterized protein n=1 Tax=Coniophora puteana (strain RWD-64-598) TaxID=741705 RepID=R7SEH5_CONPW|nr:uncharacterized protein CONPUDRAFT_67100 [Coniophora puteana RWD-64-598 SS2]EIW74578.1 hypothetical protein CONPUDRAFT_67100 [Coniophora puteana RWD-64-598 SS2]
MALTKFHTLLHCSLDGVSILFLFTKSDIKTILVPVTAFAALSARSISFGAHLRSTLWIWLHLLQFCIANQVRNPKEDSMNKPWRPIASGLISQANARSLRWAVCFICLGYSYFSGTLFISTSLSLAIFLNNDMSMDSHWLSRNFWVAYGYAMFNGGAMKVICSTSECIPENRFLRACIFVSSIIFTTVQAQDFRDAAGDIASGRSTLPVVWPLASRRIELGLITLWSSIICILWDVNAIVASFLITFGALIGLRFLLLRSARDDQQSYLLYNVSRFVDNPRGAC